MEPSNSHAATFFELNVKSPRFCNRQNVSRFGGLTFLIDGEEIATINTNTYNTQWDNVGEHTIQAVYKGNNAYSMSVSPVKGFYVKQEDEESGGGSHSTIYRLEFIDFNKDTFKYKDGSTVSVKLTQGGVPLSGEVVKLHSTTGYTTTSTTSPDGIAQLKLGGLVVGEHLLNATYEVDGAVQFSSQKRIRIIKNDAVITHAPDSPPTHYTKGGWVMIRWQEPLTWDGLSLNDRYLPVYINNKMYICETNSSGRTWIRLTNSGTYRFKAVYGGDENLNYGESNFTITV